MNVMLDHDLEALIRETVAIGSYASPHEVIREGVRLLKEREEWTQLQKQTLQDEIAIGLQQLEEGRSVTLNATTLEGIKARGRERLAALAQQESR